MRTIIGDSHKILLACSGLGMGNAARMVAVMEALGRKAEDSPHFEVYSWGAGYDFFSNIHKNCDLSFSLHRLENYGKSHCRPFFRNCRILKKAVGRIQPSLIILDSDYHFPAYWFSKCPIVSLGQAHDVVERSKNYRFQSVTETLRYYLFEKLDAWIQQKFSHQVLVPAFRNFSEQNKKIVKIPLVVREEFIRASATPPTAALGFLLSGSRFESRRFLAAAELNQLEVISPAVTSAPTRAGTLDRFDLVVTQGGLSSISECLARRKFMIVIPLPDHPEQTLNASEVERLGFGLKATIEELGNLSELIARAQHRRQMARPQPINCQGADWAARQLLGLCWGPVAHGPSVTSRL